MEAIFGFPLKTWIVAICILVFAFIASKLFHTFLNKTLFKHETSNSLPQAVPHTLLQVLSSIFVWTLATVFILDNFDIQVSALLAGLGVGGIAIALAAQNILGDFFAALTISLDRPFAIGDVLEVGNQKGIVESIGIKTTRLRGSQGEELIFGNESLLKSQISNFRQNDIKRVSQVLGLSYQTSPRDIEKLPTLIKNVIEKMQGTRFERASFLNFSESSLDLEFVYWIENIPANLAFDIQHNVNLDILSLLSENSLSLAYPTRTIFTQPTSTN